MWEEKYIGTSNSGHFQGPRLVAVALEVAVVGRFYYVYVLLKKLTGRGGSGD